MERQVIKAGRSYTEYSLSVSEFESVMQGQLRDDIRRPACRFDTFQVLGGVMTRATDA